MVQSLVDAWAINLTVLIFMLEKTVLTFYSKIKSEGRKRFCAVTDKYFKGLSNYLKVPKYLFLKTILIIL